jgi:hypothetical protein
MMGLTNMRFSLSEWLEEKRRSTCIARTCMVQLARRSRGRTPGPAVIEKPALGARNLYFFVRLDDIASDQVLEIAQTNTTLEARTDFGCIVGKALE